MVASRGDRADTVITGRETFVKSSSKKTVAIAGVIDTLEEGKGLSVRRRVGIVAHVLNGDVGMADDFTPLESLWSSVVGVVRIGERSSLQVGDLHREVNLLVRGLVVVVHGISEDCRYHLADSRDISHDYVEISDCLLRQAC
jgi:hypothetical protein